MTTESLPDGSTIARHLSPKDFDLDDLGQVTIFPHAFELRGDETYLSASWLDFFAGGFNDQVAATAAFMSTTREVRRSHALALGGVGEIKLACADFGMKIRVLHEPNRNIPNRDNAAYATVRRFKSDNLELLDLLARAAWAKLVDVRTAYDQFGPWKKA